MQLDQQIKERTVYFGKFNSLKEELKVFIYILIIFICDSNGFPSQAHLNLLGNKRFHNSMNHLYSERVAVPVSDMAGYSDTPRYPYRINLIYKKDNLIRDMASILVDTSSCPIRLDNVSF